MVGRHISRSLSLSRFRQASISKSVPRAACGRLRRPITRSEGSGPLATVEAARPGSGWRRGCAAEPPPMTAPGRLPQPSRRGPFTARGRKGRLRPHRDRRDLRRAVAPGIGNAQRLRRQHRRLKLLAVHRRRRGPTRIETTISFSAGRTATRFRRHGSLSFSTSSRMPSGSMTTRASRTPNGGGSAGCGCTTSDTGPRHPCSRPESI